MTIPSLVRHLNLKKSYTTDGTVACRGERRNRKHSVSGLTSTTAHSGIKDSVEKYTRLTEKSNSCQTVMTMP